MLILASASPRRKELLGLIAEDFRVITSDVDEEISASIRPRKAAEELALRKAKSVSEKYPRDTVIGADTVVIVDGVALGKPTDAEDAKRMLKLLRGRQHFVCTGVAVLSPEGGKVFSEQTAVTMADMSEEEISAYVATDEPFDKAGAYAIQGKAGAYISRIEGDFYNVVGLPVCRLREILKSALNKR